MSWWRRHWRWLLAAGVGLIGCIVIGILYALCKRDQAAALKAKINVMLSASKVQGLQADREARRKELEKNAALARELNLEIRKAKRETVALVRSVDTMNDIEIANAFKDLGY